MIEPTKDKPMVYIKMMLITIAFGCMFLIAMAYHFIKGNSPVSGSWMNDL